MVLVDTPVWIEYFRGSARSVVLKELIHNNTLCINNLVLAELLPFINLKKEYELKRLLLAIKRIELEIDWDHRFDNMQRHCGEHILSGVIYKLFQGTNKGFHMGEEYITIDMDFSQSDYSFR